ncbi:IS5 family transposase [Streptomyces sp. NPDC005381]|uniref:IS5 family transposase n=1 Tax=Streptomyces sp. NPDC005381 TaxID=3364714 RepID=UPI00367A7FB8
MEREPYPSDLADEQWALIEPMITAWKQDRVARSATGDPGSCDLREVVNAIFYQNRTGCQWRYLPHDLPAWSAVFYYFGLWRRDGLDQRIQELLRCQVREKARRLEDPSLVILDTQSVRAAAGVPKTTTGLDANKKVSGRKRGLAVDVLGLIIGVVVLAASAHDNTAGTALLDQAAERCGMRLEKALVDQCFKDEVLIHGALLDIDIEVVRRNPADQGKGFVPQPKRWMSASFEPWFWITFSAGATEGHHNRDHERPHAARRTRLRSRSKLARPNICRLIILILLLWPSTAPEL